MLNHLSLKKCPLFAGIGEDERESLLGCLGARIKHYPKDAFVFSAGEALPPVGIVLSGSVDVIKEDFWGNRTILARVGPGGLFGEAFSCAEVDQLPVGVRAAEPSEIMLIDYRRILAVCPSACAFHTGMIKNMTRILAQKNIQLTGKIEHIAKRTTREKLLSYLSALAVEEGSSRFALPFNRQELADYLAVDRSALSRELSLMQKEGLIRYEKNAFELIV